MATMTKNHISMICIIVVVLALTAGTASATLEDDEKDCAEQLTNLVACIPYVSGTAKQPTKECCDDTTKLKAAKPKCLCVLIKESADPSMGLPINTTLALQMPAACNIDAKISDCPKLLNIPADSPDAKMFKADDSSSSTTASNTTAAPSSDHFSSSTTPTTTTTTAAASDNTKTTATTSSNNGAKLVSTATILLVVGLASISLLLF